MKKFLLSLIALCCLVTANAQTFRIGPALSGSINLSEGTKTRLGFAVGAKGEINFRNSENSGFVGMYVGKGMFVDARGTKYGVVFREVPTSNIVFIGRP